jgi:hypothetical protein
MDTTLSCIFRSNANDPHKDVLLRLKFNSLTPAQIEGFKSEKSLATTDLELQVRPRIGRRLGEE